MTDPTPAQLAEIAACLFAVEAPRVGNDRATYESLGMWDKRRYEKMAELAVRKWESMRPNSADIADIAGVST